MSEIDPSALPESLRGPALPVGLLKRFWILLTIGALSLVAFVVWFCGAFYDQGYAPDQYIAYSHKLHAGDMHMPCLFCHFNAERGKHAGVPPMSVCLGCHAQDKGQVHVAKPEIQKLLAVAEKGAYTDADGIVHEGGMVHWNRVHKLPDHVYFSHQWHVKAGVACQTCHGPVETMDVVRQYATLTMGWCLDCHRKSNYVGGPTYKKGDPASFSVGTANYDVVRARVETDPEVEFAAPALKNDKPEKPAATKPLEPARDHSLTTAERSNEAIAALLVAHPELRERPRWRLQDLPETHRLAYRELIDQDGTVDLSRTLMNAPTQCNTCHQ